MICGVMTIRKCLGASSLPNLLDEPRGDIGDELNGSNVLGQCYVLISSIVKLTIALGQQMSLSSPSLRFNPTRSHYVAPDPSYP